MALWIDCCPCVRRFASLLRRTPESEYWLFFLPCRGCDCGGAAVFCSCHPKWRCLPEVENVDPTATMRIASREESDDSMVSLSVVSSKHSVTQSVSQVSRSARWNGDGQHRYRLTPSLFSIFFPKTRSRRRALSRSRPHKKGQLPRTYNAHQTTKCGHQGSRYGIPRAHPPLSMVCLTKCRHARIP